MARPGLDARERKRGKRSIGLDVLVPRNPSGRVLTLDFRDALPLHNLGMRLVLFRNPEVAGDRHPQKTGRRRKKGKDTQQYAAPAQRRRGGAQHRNGRDRPNPTRSYAVVHRPDGPVRGQGEMSVVRYAESIKGVEWLLPGFREFESRR